MGQLDGKVAVITGGGSGIGKGIARAFAAEGCAVALAGRNAARLQATADEIARDSGMGSEGVLAIPTDVTMEAQVVALFQQVMARWGRVDILVNSAAAFDWARIDELSLAAWQRVIDTGVTGAFLCTREAFRIMKAQGGGRIVNIGSIAAQRPRECSAAYTTSKHAIWGLTQSTALDGREFNIVASCLHPGNVAVERRLGAPAQSGKDEGNEVLMPTAEIARVALLMVTLPPDVNMLEAIVLPVGQKYLGRG